MKTFLMLASGFSFLLALPAQADYAVGLRAYERGDYTAAAREFAADAENGHAGAQNLLGLSYALGRGVPRDESEAMKWFRRAAEQGEPEGQFNLGSMYSKGQGAAVDYAEAARWFRLAAGQGHARAQLNMGVLAFNGHGLKQDSVQALMWFSLSAARGNAAAGPLRDSLLKSLSREQAAEAARLTAEWEAGHGRTPPASVAGAKTPSGAGDSPADSRGQDPAGAASPASQARIRHRQGRALTAAGQYAQAILELDEALRLAPGDAQIHNARGFAYLKLRQYSRAIADFDEAIRLQPVYPNAYMNRAAARRMAGDAQGAAEDLRKAK